VRLPSASVFSWALRRSEQANIPPGGSLRCASVRGGCGRDHSRNSVLALSRRHQDALFERDVPASSLAFTVGRGRTSDDLAYLPSGFTHRNNSLTNVSSTVLQTFASTPQRRWTCSGFRLRPGISRYLERSRTSKSSIVRTRSLRESLDSPPVHRGGAVNERPEERSGSTLAQPYYSPSVSTTGG
jgi:hypothetical protein